jgi:hypothetical protein
MSEPVAVRYYFDGYGYSYMDAGSGSDWASRVKDCEFLYIHPQKELTDEEIIEEIKNIYGKEFDYVGYAEEMQLCRNVLKKASKK